MLAGAKASSSRLYSKEISNKNILFKSTLADQSIQISSVNLDSGNVFNDIYVVAHYPDAGNPQIIDVRCKDKSSSGKAIVCSILLSTDDGAILLMQQGNNELNHIL